jgi:AcrR family transcriptional regulator
LNKRADTRQCLIDAFWALYSQKGIYKITVREITAKAECNRGTFYEYFLDVYDVLEQIENELIPEIDELPPRQASFDQPLNDFIKLYDQNSRYYNVLLGPKGDPAFGVKLKEGVKAKLKMALAATQLDPAELEYTLEFVLSAMIGILTYWFQDVKAMPKEALLALVYRLMLHGALTDLMRIPTLGPTVLL